MFYIDHTMVSAFQENVHKYDYFSDQNSGGKQGWCKNSTPQLQIGLQISSSEVSNLEF